LDQNKNNFFKLVDKWENAWVSYIYTSFRRFTQNVCLSNIFFTKATYGSI